MNDTDVSLPLPKSADYYFLCLQHPRLSNPKEPSSDFSPDGTLRPYTLGHIAALLWERVPILDDALEIISEGRLVTCLGYVQLTDPGNCRTITDPQLLIWLRARLAEELRRVASEPE